jgi:ribosome-associated heat shock protein Hsp15
MPRKTQSNHGDDAAGMRLDKWLWCARFFKTRSLAATAIRSGKVNVNGERPKPGKTIVVGTELSVRRGPYEYRIRILNLPHGRLSAATAQEVYREEPESIVKREQLALQLRADAISQPRTHGRPTKRERRQLLQFQRQGKE